MTDGLLERDGLLAELERRLDLAAVGAGSMTMIAGEAGAGKTSLVNELARRAAGRARIMIGGCDPLSTPRPLSPLLDVISDPGSELGDLLEESSDPVRLFTEFLTRLKGTMRPTALIIEDVHWADEGTLDFIRFLGRRVGDANALVMCTYRDDELDTAHPLRMVIGDLATRDAILRLSVEPLSIEAVRTLAGDTWVDPDHLHRLTGGNAFYVTEVLAAGTEFPRSVQDAVLARVSRLRPPTQRVVEAVSVAPRDLSILHASALAGARPTHVDEATNSGVLIGTGDRLRFRHELARTAVESSIPTGSRLDLHRRMIDLLSEETPADLARLAHHAAMAEAGELVAEYGPLAAKEASIRGAHREAVSFYEATLAHSSRLSADQVAAIRFDLGLELAIVDRQAEALEHQLLALEHHRGTGDLWAIARTLVSLGSRYWANRQTGRARESIDEALEIYESLDAGEELAFALYVSATTFMLSRRRDAARRDVARCAAKASEVGSDRVSRLALLTEGTIEIVVGDPDRGIELLREAYERSSRAGDDRAAVIALGMLGSGGGEARRYDVAIEALEMDIKRGLELDEDYGVAYSRAWMARIAFEQGRWDDAAVYADLVAEGPSGRGSISPVTALGALGRVRVRRGDPGARAALEEAVALGEGGEMQHLWPPLCGLAELAWLEGRSDEIGGILEWVFAEAMRADSEWARGEVGFWMWKAGVIDSPPDRAAEPFDLHMRGGWREAADRWHQIGCPYEEALALADGDTDAMLRAIEIFDSLGARPAASMTRAVLRDRGVDNIPRGPRPGTMANPYRLTGRQAEVLSLMGEGLSNGEIADRLFLSKKTVEHHVSAILAKLGATTRARAIAAVGGLLSPQDGGTPRIE
ncbi:MAG TPA: AAA family ATPase [Acidimicrobiia bacterium]